MCFKNDAKPYIQKKASEAHAALKCRASDIQTFNNNTHLYVKCSFSIFLSGCKQPNSSTFMSISQHLLKYAAKLIILYIITKTKKITTLY
jgi:hypothetical protein